MKPDWNANLIGIAHSFRRNMTKEENHLWYDFLRNYPVRFRRQEIIGSFIAEFYCDKAKLIVELDGSQHYAEGNLQEDTARTAYFNDFGLEVIRFSNLDVMKNFEGVCTAIIIRWIRFYPIKQEV